MIGLIFLVLVGVILIVLLISCPPIGIVATLVFVYALSHNFWMDESKPKQGDQIQCETRQAGLSQ